MESMKRKGTYLLVRLLDGTGITLYENLENPNHRIKIYAVTVLYGIFTMSMFSVINRDDFYNLVTPAAYVAALTILLCGVLGLYHNKNKIRTMLELMDGYIFTYSDEHLIKVEYGWVLDEKNIVTIFVIVLTYELVGYISACFSPFISLALYGKIKTYIYPAYTPWTIDGFTSSAATYFSQLYVATFSIWGYYVNTMYMLFILIEFLRQYKRLATALATIRYRTGKHIMDTVSAGDIQVEQETKEDLLEYVNFKNSNVKQQYKDMFNEIYQQKLKQCIQHHQILTK